MESEVMTAAASAGEPDASRAWATIAWPALVAAPTGANAMIARVAPAWTHREQRGKDMIATSVNWGE